MGFQDQSEFNMLPLSLLEIKCFNSTLVHLPSKKTHIEWQDFQINLQQYGRRHSLLPGMLLSLIGLTSASKLCVKPALSNL